MSKENKEVQKEEVKMRQIIIETDGTKIQLVKHEVAGEIELVAILNLLISSIQNKQ